MPDFSTYAARQAYRDAHPGVIVDANSASDGAVNTGPSGGGGGGSSSSGGGGNGIGQSAPGFNAGQFASQITSALTPLSQATSGVTAAELAEKKRQFDANLEWTKQMWANQGMPELQIKQQAAQLARDEFEQQKKVVADNLALAQRTQAAQESQFGQTLAQNQSQFGATMGLDYLKTAASMGGPADVFQASDFTRGAAASGQVPAFLKALQANTGLAGFGATTGAAPQALTPGVIANRLTTGATGGQNDAALTAIGGIAQAGGGALAPQALEQLNPDEMAAMGSGFKKLGYSLPAFLQTYQQSRIGQGAAQAA